MPICTDHPLSVSLSPGRDHTHLIKQTHTFRSLYTLVVASFLSVCIPLYSWADEPITGINNQCEGPGGIGKDCSNDSECADNTLATKCISEPNGLSCRVPCGNSAGSNEPVECTVGEICDESGPVAYCKDVPFRMDLNLLDQCIKHWVEGSQPVFSENQCFI